MKDTGACVLEGVRSFRDEKINAKISRSGPTASPSGGSFMGASTIDDRKFVTG